MKSVLILNPVAGRWRPAGIEERIDRALRKHGISCEILRTEKAGDASALARRVAGEGCELVIAAGGDGTVNEVVNGLVGTGVTLGILPLGTVNVLARDFGISLDPKKAIRTLAGGIIKNIDLGCANGRYFTIMAGCGFDAEVVANVLQPIKDLIGGSAYVLKSLETLAKYLATDVVLEMPDETYSTKAFLIVIANVSTYSYNMKITPHASHDNGLLDICVFERPIMDRIGFMHQLADVFVNRHLYHRAVQYFRTTKVTVKSDPEIMVQLDGDSFGTTPVEISIIPRILPVIVPGK